MAFYPTQNPALNPFSLLPSEVLNYIQKNKCFKHLIWISLALRIIRCYKLKMSLSVWIKSQIWEDILDIGAQLEYEQTVPNLFAALSPLHSTFQSRKKLWLFGKILPLLCEHRANDNWSLLDSKDLLSLRAVCKDWRKGVDNYLGSQPSLQVIKDDETMEDARALALRKDLFGDTSFGFNSSGFGAGYRFHFDVDVFKKPELALSEIHATVASLDKPNPSLVRSLVIKSVSIQCHGSEELNRQFWLGILEYVEKFGEDLWALEVHTLPIIHHELQSYLNGIWRAIFEATPNLKFITFRGGLSCKFPVYICRFKIFVFINEQINV